MFGPWVTDLLTVLLVDQEMLGLFKIQYWFINFISDILLLKTFIMDEIWLAF